MSLRISNTGVKILLFQIVPGREFDASNEIRDYLKELSEKRYIGKFETWKLFGTYDLLCVYEVFNYDPELLYLGSIPGIQRSNEIFAFGWENTTRNKRVMSFSFNGITQKPILALSFRKIDPSIVRRDRSVEQSFIDFTVSEYKTVQTLSTLGWSEFAQFICDGTVRGVMKQQHALTTGTRIVFRPKDVKTFFIKSYSLIGIRTDVLKSKKSLKKTLSEKFGVSDEDDPKYQEEAPVVQLALKCRPGAVSSVARRYHKVFCATHTDIAIGQYDIILDLSGATGLGDWATFVERLLKLRRDGSGDVLDTATLIQARVPHASQNGHSKKGRLAKMTAFKVDGPTVDQVRHLPEAVGYMVLNSIYSFNGLISQPLIRDCFADLFPFVRSLVASLEEGVLATRVLLGDTEKKLERFGFAVDQRAMGAFTALENPEGRFSPYKGGIQRILYALTTVPRHLIEDVCGVDWSGFVVIGFDRRFWHRGAILNLPVDKALNPSDWWGLTHESAHAISEVRPEWFPTKKFVRTIFERLNYSMPPSEVTLISEILIDHFDFLFCFEGDWKSYIRTVWGYFGELEGKDEYIDTRIDDYFLRAFSVYFMSTYRDGDPERRVTDRELNQMYSKFLSSLRTLARWVDDKGDDSLETIGLTVCERFALIRPALPLISSSVAEYSRRFERRMKSRRYRGTKSAMKRILQGYTVDKQLDPALLVLQLKKSKVVPFRARIATIISLWNQFLREYDEDQAFAPRRERTR